MATRKKSRKKYSAGAQKKVKKVMHERKAGTLRSGRSKKRVKSRKQAIAIGLSEARRAGEDVPSRPSSKKTSRKKSTSKKSSSKKSARKKSSTSARSKKSSRRKSGTRG